VQQYLAGGMQEQANILETGENAHDDAELMRQVAAGDQRALRKLMAVHLARTVRMATRVLGSTAAAEDVAQEAFIRVWKHAGDFEAPDKAGAKFTTWLYRIVLNLCIDEKRKKIFSGLDDMPEQPDGARNVEERMQQQEQSRRVKQALSELPERQRAAFVLCFYEEYSNKEAADMLGISVKAIESLLVRSRKSLREKLQTEKGLS
jgi:RNA polymerase sigma-70 factor (ECF subfamily)